jgi:hypothetical protein
MYTQKKVRLVHQFRVVAVLLTASLMFQTLFISGQGEGEAFEGGAIGTVDITTKDFNIPKPYEYNNNTENIKVLERVLRELKKEDFVKVKFSVKVPPVQKISNFFYRENTLVSSGKSNDQNVDPKLEKFWECLKRNGVDNATAPRNDPKRHRCLINPNHDSKPVSNAIQNSSNGSGSNNRNILNNVKITPVVGGSGSNNLIIPKPTSNWWTNLGTLGQVGVGVGGIAATIGIVALLGSGKKNTTPSDPPTIVSAPPVVTPPVVTPPVVTPPVVTPVDPVQPIKDLLAKLDEEKLDALRLTFSTTGGILLPTSPAAINLIRDTDFKIVRFYNTNLLVIPPLTPTTIIEHDVNNDGVISKDDPKLIEDIHDKCVLNQTVSPCRAFYDRTIKFTP